MFSEKQYDVTFNKCKMEGLYIVISCFQNLKFNVKNYVICCMI